MFRDIIFTNWAHSGFVGVTFDADTKGVVDVWWDRRRPPTDGDTPVWGWAGMSADMIHAADAASAYSVVRRDYECSPRDEEWLRT